MKDNSESTNLGRVLVIDDEPAVLTTLERFLSRAGYEVHTAPSGQEGLRLFQSQAWDVVTIDRSMPGMNGEEAAAEMKRLSPTVPVILITGFPGAATRPQLFHTILGKPFRLDELLNTVASGIRSNPNARRTEAQAPAENIYRPERSVQCLKPCLGPS